MQLLDHSSHTGQLNCISKAFPFSFQESYGRFLHEQGAQLLFFYSSGVIAPFALRKSKFLTIIQFQFRPLDASAGILEPDAERKFLDAAVDYTREHKLAHRIVQPANFALFGVAPAGSIHAPYGSYVLSLSGKTDEALLAGMQARYRTAIRAAHKLAPEIRTGESELYAFWQLHKATMQRTRMYYEPYAELQHLCANAAENVLVATCYINNELQGGVFLIWTSYSAYYLHGASGNTPLSDGAIKYLHYWCMCYLKRQGAERYDFVGARLSDVSGTKLEGIQNFKKRFGSELEPGFLWKKDISPFVCRAYDSLLHLKLTLKGAKFPQDIIEQERSK